MEALCRVRAKSIEPFLVKIDFYFGSISTECPIACVNDVDESSILANPKKCHLEIISYFRFAF